MALPEGILTGTVTFGQAVSLIGGRATSMTFTIKPTHDLVHVDSGLQILDFTETITVEEGMPGSITLPYTDQPGFRNAAGEAFTNWAYQVTGVFRGPGGQSKSFTKNFQLPTGQEVVDLDLIPGGSISLPVTAPVARVTSVAGKTGAITVDDLVDAGLGGGGAVPDEGITEAKLAPDAVTQAKIAPAAVGNAELDSEAVTASKIAADAVTGVKVASGAIAKSKLASALQSEIDGKLTQTQVDARVEAVGSANYAPFKTLAKNPDLLVTGNITRNSDQAVTSAAVKWPDGTVGTFTAETLSIAFPGAVDGYRITYGDPATKTYTQPTVTRNATGAATVVPEIVVS